MGFFSSLFAVGTPENHATLVTWTDRKMRELRRVNDITPETMLVGFMYALVSFARDDKPSPPNSSPFPDLHVYKNDAALFELGCFLHERITEELVDNQQSADIPPLSRALFREYVILFVRTFQDPRIEQVYKQRLSMYAGFAADDAGREKCFHHLVQLVLRTRHNSKPMPYTPDDDYVELAVIDQTMMTMKLANWIDAMMPSIFKLMQDFIRMIK